MRILIVDDEPLNCFLLTNILEQEGYTECFEAGSGSQALAMAEKLRPDLILLDVLMPDMSGFEVAPKLKAMAADNYLPIIFITSLEDRASLIKCLEVGGDDFVSKPFDKLVLTAKIRAHARIRSLSIRIKLQNEELLTHRQLVEREHSIVEHIFANAIHHSKPLASHFDFNLSPAAQFNGDVFLTQESPAGGAYYLIGDFTGHGLASAIGMLPVARSFQTMAEKGLPVSQMARALNSILLNLLPADMFFAAIIAEVDESGCRHLVWHGGMPQMLVKSVNGGISTHGSNHMALGILDDDEFEDRCVSIECDPGDKLLLYTDGLIEIVDENDVMLDEDGVVLWFASHDFTATSLYNKAIDYQTQDEQVDDITVVIFTCKPMNLEMGPLQTPPFPIDIRTQLHSEQLRRDDVISRLVDIACAQPEMAMVRSKLFTVLAELYSNALEHGVLGLDSGIKSEEDGFSRYYTLREQRLAELREATVEVQVLYKPGQNFLTIVMRDSGKGFDLDHVQQEADFVTFGRGLSLIFELSRSVTYTEGGTCAQVVLSLRE
ncbi:ATP-binding SpoIIE family protein phosphatase [Salinimonas lutimaris]|uniref:ATP-binding SpoIIE family protein phosphatase n=1 Tax=Salinimonas lutimaris TaxID=914153 RepID=UPI0010C0B578|nr:fused response regulator/phosphatase [Salinimonas lutimaris]